MLALTLRHPWVYAIARLGKGLENRTWRPYANQLRPGDWFAIHGGVDPKGAVRDEALDDLASLRDRGLAPPTLRLEDAILGGVACVCRFDGVVESSDDPWFGGPLGWVLGETVVLPAPIPCRGKQGLWPLPEDVLATVRAGYRTARSKTSKTFA